MSQPLPWLVGLAPCDSVPKRRYTRGFAAGAAPNTEWSVTNRSGGHYQVKSLSTGRCLTDMGTSQDSSGHLASQSSGAPVLLPCDDSNPEQAWDFGKGINSPSSLYSVKSGNALGVDSATLFSSAHKYKGGNDPFQVTRPLAECGLQNIVSLGSVSHTDRAVLQVPSAAYGATTLQMVARHDQQGCARRGCENYDDTQMWWFDPVDSLLRLSTYTASLNHAVNGGQQLTGGGTGYLTPKTPTYQHHCLAHVLSNDDTGTAVGNTEVWGGPLAGGEWVMAALNRGGGNGTATIALSWAMLGAANVTAASRFDVRDLWAGKLILRGQAGGLNATVPAHDIAIYRLVPAG